TGADLEATGVKPLPTTPDFRRADGRPTVTPLRRGLAHEFARYVGEELPAVADARAAREPGAAVVTEEAPDNIAAEMRHGDAAATEAAFARAAHRVALEVHNQRLAPAPMEPRSVVARFDEASGRLEVRIGNQMPTAVAGGISGCLPGLKPTQVQVLVGDVGGGFGMKTGPYAEDL